MESLNNSNDIRYYLLHGNLTQPFLSDEYVLEKVLIDYNSKVDSGHKITKIESLYNWIDKNVNYARGDNEFLKRYKFQRTAEEIWESKKMTGCTDYAILFATFARQIGIPTTFLHTAEKNWLISLKNNVKNEGHRGHSFCECFYEGKWMLVDPTQRKLQQNYNPDCLKLAYQVNGNFEFVPYFRGLDLEKKQTIKEHNLIMDDLCNKWIL